jgi:hypothetical protein
MLPPHRALVLVALCCALACSRRSDPPAPTAAPPPASSAASEPPAAGNPAAARHAPGAAPALIGELTADDYRGCACSLATADGALVFWDDGPAVMRLGDELVTLADDGAFGIAAERIGDTHRDEFRVKDIAVRIDWTVTSVCGPDDEDCEAVGVEASITASRGEVQHNLRATGSCGC